LKKRRAIVLGVVLTVLSICIYGMRDRVHFDWHTFGQQLKLADWKLLAVATMLTWLTYGTRSLRWELFLKPTRRVRPLSLLGTQIIGFTGTALLGRPAELVRPYLVSKRVKATLGSQLAIYVVERMFDAGAMALIFSLALIFAPDRASLPHPELLKQLAKTGLLGTAVLACATVLLRMHGDKVAFTTERMLGRISPSLARSTAVKINEFREGLATLASTSDVLLALLLSLATWGMIAGSYLETTHAFSHSPVLANMTLARCMVLMAASMAASTLQFPLIGWFTQIATVAAATKEIFGAQIEPSIACATTLLIIGFLSIVPVGLVWSHLEHVSFKQLTKETEQASEGAVAVERTDGAFTDQPNPLIINKRRDGRAVECT
jgi:uncharacterized protein (TIRG00374 family)